MSTTRTDLLQFGKRTIALMCAALAACTSETRSAPLRLGTTHTVEQSGALALLDSLHAPVALRVVIGPSGQILRSAAAGDLDVVITHAPSLEQRILVAPGRVAARCPFVASRFAVVGPAPDPARVAGAATAADAFRRIATARALFVSRGDSSGTHVKELALWSAAGVSPPPGARDAWYVQAGVDQAATLRIADERRGYALADLPTFARQAGGGGGLELQILFSEDTVLANPYTLYVIRPASASPAVVAGAARFTDWALATWRPRLLALPAFAAIAGECAAL